MVLAQVSSKNRGWVGGLKVMLPQVTSHGLKSSLTLTLHKANYRHMSTTVMWPKVDFVGNGRGGYVWPKHDSRIHSPHIT